MKTFCKIFLVLYERTRVDEVNCLAFENIDNKVSLGLRANSLFGIGIIIEIFNSSGNLRSIND